MEKMWNVQALQPSARDRRSPSIQVSLHRPGMVKFEDMACHA
jgi:hypothetical protein